MPHFVESSSSGSSDAESISKFALDAQHIVSDAEYAGDSFPGSSEVPLSEQLEPIAVVGMGKRSLLAHVLNMYNNLRVDRLSPTWGRQVAFGVLEDDDEQGFGSNTQSTLVQV